MKNLEGVIAAYRKARAARLAQDQIVVELKAAEMIAKEELMVALDNHGLQKAGDGVSSVSKTKKSIVTITDWPAFYEHIQKTGEFDLLQKRPGLRAIGDRADIGVEIPGAKLGHIWDLSISTKE